MRQFVPSWVPPCRPLAKQIGVGHATAHRYLRDFESIPQKHRSAFFSALIRHVTAEAVRLGVVDIAPTISPRLIPPQGGSEGGLR